MTQKSRIRLLVLGLSELKSALHDADFEVMSYDDHQVLLEQARSVGARACVVNPGVFHYDSGKIRNFVGRLRREMPFTDVVAWSPQARAEEVRSIMLQGVKDVILDGKPNKLIERLREIIKKQTYLPRMLSHRNKVADKWQFEGFLSRSQKMRDIFEVCIRTAATDATVLIFGETGTGKELLARAFHRRSDRHTRMVALNCAAVPENLIDSELFGHVKGAFTGASSEKTGLFRYAEGGTLFLDEVGHIPLQVQYRLLRVLQEGCIRPVGGDKEIPVDVRIIAATSVRLDEAVAAGRFREDLLYRLDVIRVFVPPLRERPEDILFLFGHFLKQLAKHYNLRRPETDEGFLDAMQSYHWPGNVRQMENFTERLLLTRSDQGKVTADHFRNLIAPVAGSKPLDAVVCQAENNADLETEIHSSDSSNPIEPSSPVAAPAGEIEEPDLDMALGLAVEKAVVQTECAYIENALRIKSGKVSQAASQLGISRRTLQRKMAQHGFDKKNYKSIRADSSGKSNLIDDGH